MKQSGLGGRGRQIYLYKFRTTVTDMAQKGTGLDLKKDFDSLESLINEDLQFTVIGKFLSKSGLDQFPKLFNVLKGDISIIGPCHPLQNNTLHYTDYQ